VTSKLRGIKGKIHHENKKQHSHQQTKPDNNSKKKELKIGESARMVDS
jgi:hypothetical protein